MVQTWFRLVFAVLLAVVGAVLLLRHTLFRADVFDQFNSTRLNVGGTLAVVLAVYNLFRSWLGFRVRRRRSAPVNPLARPTSGTKREYLPDLDFTTRRPTGPPDPGSAPPSTSSG